MSKFSQTSIIYCSHPQIRAFIVFQYEHFCIFLNTLLYFLDYLYTLNTHKLKFELCSCLTFLVLVARLTDINLENMSSQKIQPECLVSPPRSGGALKGWKCIKKSPKITKDSRNSTWYTVSLVKWVIDVIQRAYPGWVCGQSELYDLQQWLRKLTYIDKYESISIRIK